MSDRATTIGILTRMSSSTRIGLLALATAFLPLSPPALAHHSFAMFDATQTLTVQATVKEFQWGNPHTWINLVVLAPDGVAKPLSLELNGLSGLRRNGWKPGSVQPGDKVNVAYHPMRDGTPAGQLVQLVTADGKTLKGQ
jgi:hypothetical protein